MNKDKLVAIIAETHGYSKVETSRIVETVFEEIKKTLSEGEEVSIHGFGKFVVRDRKAREGINPKTKEKLQIPASKAVGFKPSKPLKDAVKN